MRRLVASLSVLLVLPVLFSNSARGAEITDVASSFEAGNPFDFRFRFGYGHLEKRASIRREIEQAGQGTIPVFKDLNYAQSRDTLNMRMEIGLFWDLMLYTELPVILNDTRDITYAGGVTAANSTTVRDNIVPTDGYDAATGTGFVPGSGNVFRGPRRGGSGSGAFDTFNVGLTWAPLSQKRDDTKPTWIINVEGRFSIGQVMKFDRTAPTANKGVSEGLHWFVVRTAVSKRFRYVDPFFGLWYGLPIARSGSLFIDYGKTQKNKGPQMSAGTVFGLEVIPYERKDKEYKVSIALQGRIEGKFTGRGYSEIWEMLAASPALDCDPVWNPACDPSATVNRYQGRPYTGLTTIDNYASLGIDTNVYAQVTRYLRLHAGFQYQHDQSHFVTADDVGKTLDATCTTPTSGGRVSRACEFNPAYRPVINQIGRRYKVDDVNLYGFTIWAQVMF